MVGKLAGVLREVATRVCSPFNNAHHVAREKLAASWTNLRLAVMQGQVNPATTILIGYRDGDNRPGSITVQAILKTVEDGWGYWDRGTTEWWCQLLEDANSSLVSRA